MENNTLTITDNRTGKTYDVAIEDNAIRAMDVRKIKEAPDDFGLMIYDPSYYNTASCRSRITYVDGQHGILRYRGYPVAELAEQTTFLETAYLLLYKELPTQAQLEAWVHDVSYHSMVNENIRRFLEGFRHDAHPIGMLIGAVAALSTFYPDARNVEDPVSVELQTRRLIAKLPTLAAYAYRHSLGLPIVHPDNTLSYTGNFLSMMYKMFERTYQPDPVLERALDKLFILHIDHGQSSSASTMRMVGSSLADPYVGVAAAIGSLNGPRHAGASAAVYQTLEEIGDVKNIPALLEQVKRGERLLMGFGHRVYKSMDPRVPVIKHIAEEVYEHKGPNRLLDIALELERAALADDFFIERHLYPNVDFYNHLIYQALGLPTNMFTVLFAVPRTVGWVAQWRELLEDSEQKIARPRQIFVGVDKRDYVPMSER